MSWRAEVSIYHHMIWRVGLCLFFVWSKLTLQLGPTRHSFSRYDDDSYDLEHAYTMGFLKRFFSLKSIGSKKKQNQKQQKQDERQEQQGRRQLVLNTNEELRVLDDQEHEADIGRLLRSSSARYAVVSEVDYASFPPLRRFYPIYMKSGGAKNGMLQLIPLTT